MNYCRGIIYLGMIFTITSILLTFSTISIIYRYPDVQNVLLSLLVTDSSDNLAPGVHIVVFHLAEKGPQILIEGYTDQNGMYRRAINIPREENGITEKGETIFASVNLWIIASSSSLYEIGTLTIPVDPTELKWPTDTIILHIKMKKISITIKSGNNVKFKTLVEAPPSPGYYEESWKFTKVLEWRTWNNIWGRERYVAGSKIRVQSKERLYDTSEEKYISGWDSAGYTEVTLNSGLTGAWRTGKYNRTLFFELKYAYTTQYGGLPFIIIEKIYAVDTSTDPRDYNRKTESWSGSLPGYSNYYTTLQNDMRHIPITGLSSGWTFTVSPSFSYVFGISLGVTKQPSPTSYLDIETGTWTDNYKVRTESNDDSFLKTWSNWVPP